MNTTNLLVDILIIGIQVLTWVSGIVFSFVVDPKKINIQFDNIIFIGLIISVAYILGIMFDYLIAILFKEFRSDYEKAIYERTSTIKIIEKTPSAHEYLENQFARLRISKSTVVNLPLITISTLIFINKNNFEEMLFPYANFIILILGIIFSILAFYSWRQRNNIYLKYILQVNQLI